MMKSSRRKKLLIHLILIAGIGITVLPFLWMLCTSFKTKGESMMIPPTILPERFVTEAYHNVLTALPFGRIYMNTVFSTVITVAGQVVICTLLHIPLPGLSFREEISCFCWCFPS